MADGDETHHESGMSRRELLLYLAVPLTSFGGTLIALVLGAIGAIDDPGGFGWGCVAGSCILCYLSLTLPRRDIVSLFTPIFAVLIFVMPLEIHPNLLLQLLYAASITILAVRLHLRFSTASPSKETDSMENYLEEYIGRLIPKFSGLTPAAAHAVASTFLSFKFGLYSNAAKEAEKARSLLPDRTEYHALRTALAIVGERASRLEKSNVSPVTDIAFNGDDILDLAVALPPGAVADEPTLTLDNALLLLYSVAVIASEDDTLALEEHRKSALQILGAYRKALGL